MKMCGNPESVRVLLALGKASWKVKWSHELWVSLVRAFPWIVRCLVRSCRVGLQSNVHSCCHSQPAKFVSLVRMSGGRRNYVRVGFALVEIGLDFSYPEVS